MYTEIELCYRESGIMCVSGTCIHCDSARHAAAQAARRMAMEDLEAEWSFWNVGGTWFGKRSTGELIKAGTYAAIVTKAEHHEAYPY